jgi:hypothetical protein
MNTHARAKCENFPPAHGRVNRKVKFVLKMEQTEKTGVSGLGGGGLWLRNGRW